MHWYDPVCDETQNLSETESETFFRYQFFSIPNPILFSIPNFFRNRYRYFYRYQKFSKPILILFLIPTFFETDTDTFSETKFFSKPIPIPSKNMEKFRNRIWSFLDQHFGSNIDRKRPKKRSYTKSFRNRYFYWYQFFPKPIPILISIPKKFRNRYRYFFRYQIFSKPIPILFPIPNFFETDTDTFFDTKNFRNRYRYHQKNGKVSKPRSFETEMSHSAG